MITSSPYFNESTGYGTEPPRKQRAIRTDLVKLTDKNVGQLRKLFLHTFPVKYTEELYKQIVQYHEFSRLVGAICARVEPSPSDSSRTRVYIMTISVLSAYRRAGIASHLLNELMKQVEEKKAQLKIDSIELNVQVGNEGALKFYEKHGFTNTGIQENYYRTLGEHRAHILVKKL